MHSIYFSTMLLLGDLLLEKLDISPLEGTTLYHDIGVYLGI